jgi:hypothetical protein
VVKCQTPRLIVAILLFDWPKDCPMRPMKNASFYVAASRSVKKVNDHWAGNLRGLAPVTGEVGPKSDRFDDAGAHPIPCICDPRFVACQGREKWSVDAETGLLLLQHVGEDSV